MVVIDAEKHNYDYKKSEYDNNIDELKRLYQQKNDGSGRYGGASTIISKAKSPEKVPKRKGSPTIAEDGSLVYKNAPDNELYYQKRVKDKVTGQWHDKMKRDRATGEMVPDIRIHTQDSTKMAETPDARKLISEYNTPMEVLYADYANNMKRLAKEARKSILSTGNIIFNKAAREEYKGEVASIEAQLIEAKKNKPKERRAQAIANSAVNAIKAQYKDLTDEELGKISQQQLVKARARVGAKRGKINISDRGWEAIQKGAFRESTLREILQYADQDELRKRSTPNKYLQLSDAKISKLRSLNATGLYSLAEMAEIMNVSTSTIKKYLKE